MSLERAVQLITSVPAALFGLRDRGVVREGAHADLVVFDPETIGTGDVRLVDDLPGGTSRLFADSVGVHRVLVNGRPIVVDGAVTGDAARHRPALGPRHRDGRRSPRVPEIASGSEQPLHFSLLVSRQAS